MGWVPLCLCPHTGFSPALCSPRVSVAIRDRVLSPTLGTVRAGPKQTSLSPQHPCRGLGTARCSVCVNELLLCAGDWLETLPQLLPLSHGVERGRFANLNFPSTHTPEGVELSWDCPGAGLLEILLSPALSLLCWPPTKGPVGFPAWLWIWWLDRWTRKSKL